MNYPNDYIYKYVEEEISKQNLYDKKVLFVFGDSWTNNRYKKNPKKHWCYLLKQKLDYDLVVNISNYYDSNYEIFDCVKKTLSDKDYPMNQQSYLDKLKEFKVVIDWSTPMRDSTSVAEMYSPWNAATIPNLDSKKPNTK